VAISWNGKSCNYNFIHPIQYLNCSEMLRFYMGSWDNTVGILTTQWVGQLRNHDASPSKGNRIFLLYSIESCSRSGSTSHSVSNGESTYRNTSDQSMKQTTHSHLVLTLRMYGAIPPLPHIPLWHAQRQLHLSHAARTILTVLHYMSHTLQQRTQTCHNRDFCMASNEQR